MYWELSSSLSSGISPFLVVEKYLESWPLMIVCEIPNFQRGSKTKLKEKKKRRNGRKDRSSSINDEEKNCCAFFVSIARPDEIQAGSSNRLRTRPLLTTHPSIFCSFFILTPLLSFIFLSVLLYTCKIIPLFCCFLYFIMAYILHFRHSTF